MSKYDKFVKTAEDAALNSNHYQHRIGAVIVNGSTVISVGWNKDHLHAEHSAINRAWKSDVKGATMIVLRLRRLGSHGMARPCKTCLERLAQAGIKKVIYTNEFGYLEKLKVLRPDKVKKIEYPYLKVYDVKPLYNRYDKES